MLHCSIFWFMWGVQLNALSIITPKYRVVSTVSSFFPFIYSRVAVLLFLGENNMATVFSGLNVRLAVRLLSTRWFSTVCILCCIIGKFVPCVSMHRSSANPCPSVNSVFMMSNA